MVTNAFGEASANIVMGVLREQIKFNQK